VSFLIVMPLLGLAFVPALVLVAGGSIVAGLLVLVPMLIAGVAAAAWWTLRFLAIEEGDGEPSLRPRRAGARRSRPL